MVHTSVKSYAASLCISLLNRLDANHTAGKVTNRASQLQGRPVYEQSKPPLIRDRVLDRLQWLSTPPHGSLRPETATSQPTDPGDK